jgi:hypothetical protein
VAVEDVRRAAGRRGVVRQCHAPGGGGIFSCDLCDGTSAPTILQMKIGRQGPSIREIISCLCPRFLNLGPSESSTKFAA